jgi:ABC-2 type transport system permease protein
VTSEDLPVLYTLEGHGELDLDSTIESDIEKANIEIKSVNLLTEGSIPEDMDCLMILAPTSDISEDERDLILDYLENGGKAIIFTDYTDQSMDNMDAVLENYGVQRAEGIVLEGDNQHYAMQMPYFLVPNILSTDLSSETASSGYYVLAPYAQGIVETESKRDTLNIVKFLTTSDSAYSKVNLSSDTLDKESDDIDGPFALGVYITEEGEEDETQIVYYSTSKLLDSSVNSMVSGGNEQLILESLTAICGSEDSVTVSIPSKSLEVSYLTMTDYDSSYWKMWTMGIIPVLFLIAGFIIWNKRRKA